MAGEYLNCYIGLALVLLGLFVGKIIEWVHYYSLLRRESILNQQIIITNLSKLPDDVAVGNSFLCSGSVVIASDAFKNFAAGLKDFVGGDIGVYETLIERARREALLRIMKDALDKGCDMILNVRFESVTLGRGKNFAPTEMVAYGTGIAFAPESKYLKRKLLSGDVAPATR